MRVAVFVALLACSGAATGTNLKQFWSTRTDNAPHLQSIKSSADLEMCLGLELSRFGSPPSVLDGDGEKLITLISSNGWTQTPVGGVRIIDHGTSRELIVGALHTGGWTRRISRAAQRCV